MTLPLQEDSCHLSTTKKDSTCHIHENLGMLKGPLAVAAATKWIVCMRVDRRGHQAAVACASWQDVVAWLTCRISRRSHGGGGAVQIPLGYADHLLLLVRRPASPVPTVSTATAGVSSWRANPS